MTKSPGFSVDANQLQSGSQQVATLQQNCQAIAANALAALAGMAGEVSHPGLASALNEATVRGNKAFTGMWAAYGHVCQGLAASGANYDGAEQANVSAATAAAPGQALPLPSALSA